VNDFVPQATSQTRQSEHCMSMQNVGSIMYNVHYLDILGTQRGAR
jgi:hypothetical protein